MPEGGGEAPESSALPPPPAAVREDQVQNAVAFLSHPKVRVVTGARAGGGGEVRGGAGGGGGGTAPFARSSTRAHTRCCPAAPAQVRASTPASKRDFLERKGLSSEEIDEAFRRVPDAPTGVTPAPPPPAPSHALQAAAQHLQPPLPPQQYALQPGYALQQQQQPPQQQQQLVAPEQQPVRWTQVVLGAAFTAAGAYALKALLWPYVEEAVGSWRGGRARGAVQDGEAAAAEATRAVAEAIKARGACVCVCVCVCRGGGVMAKAAELRLVARWWWGATAAGPPPAAAPRCRPRPPSCAPRLTPSSNWPPAWRQGAARTARCACACCAAPPRQPATSAPSPQPGLPLHCCHRVEWLPSCERSCAHSRASSASASATGVGVWVAVTCVCV